MSFKTFSRKAPGVGNSGVVAQMSGIKDKDKKKLLSVQFKIVL
jgi:hypothetical protein